MSFQKSKLQKSKLGFTLPVGRKKMQFNSRGPHLLDAREYNNPPPLSQFPHAHPNLVWTLKLRMIKNKHEISYYINVTNSISIVMIINLWIISTYICRQSSSQLCRVQVLRTKFMFKVTFVDCVEHFFKSQFWQYIIFFSFKLFVEARFLGFWNLHHSNFCFFISFIASLQSLTLFLHSLCTLCFSIFWRCCGKSKTDGT